jgi:hypothetical protein
MPISEIIYSISPYKMSHVLSKNHKQTNKELSVKHTVFTCLMYSGFLVLIPYPKRYGKYQTNCVLWVNSSKSSHGSRMQPWNNCYIVFTSFVHMNRSMQNVCHCHNGHNMRQSWLTILTNLLDKHSSLCSWLLEMVMFCSYKTVTVNFGILSFWTSFKVHLHLSLLNINCHHCWLYIMNLVSCHTSTTVNILSFARPEVLTAVTEDYQYVHTSWTILKMEAESFSKSLVTTGYTYLHGVIS